MYLYSNTYGDVTELPEKVCKILRENKENGSFKDAYLTDDRLNQMASDIYNEYGSTLLYGPVAIPEFDSEVYGFLQRTVTIWRTSGTESGMRRWRTRHSQSQR